jgi:hypothetical protein
VCAGTATLGSESAIYTGMTDNKREGSQGKRVVMDLVEPCFGSWRGVTVHNVVTSAALAAELIRQSITVTGPMYPNK